MKSAIDALLSRARGCALPVETGADSVQGEWCDDENE